MVEFAKTTLPVTSPLSIMDGIYQRRSVRRYTSQRVDKATVQVLLYAATQAPTAMHEEPWAFVVIQDKEVLDRLSDDAKKMILKECQSSDAQQSAHALEMVSDPAFDIFYDASTLIVICGKPLGQFVAADCWLAAENLLLAAYAARLGSCVIGFAVAALNSPEWKRELSIPQDCTAYAPIIVGYAAGETPPSPRKMPEIIAWK